MSKRKAFTREEVADIDGAKTALALCGYSPFGDVTSIRHRLDMARAQVEQLTKWANELEPQLPKDPIVRQWRREIEVWEYAIQEGEKLLGRESKNPKHKR